MKIALVADTHFGARQDSPIFHDYFQKFFDEQFFPYVKENNIKHIIHLGDLLDRRKFVNFKTLEVCKRSFIDPVIENDIDTHIIIGNHDTYLKNTNKINSANQLFGNNKNIKIYSECSEVLFDGISMAFVPWINSENERNTLEFLKNTKSQLLFGHLELCGFEVQRGVKHETGMDSNILKKFDMVMSGHFHIKQNNGHIYYLGTPYELIFTDLGDNKGFYVFDTDDRSLEFIQNPVQMFLKIVYDDRKEQVFEYEKYKNKYLKIVVMHKSNILEFEKFLDKIHESSAAHVTIIEDSMITNATDEAVIGSQDTLSLLNNYIDQINMKEDKQPLKNIMHDLFVESSTREF